MSDDIEQMIQEKGRTAPRVTPQDVENNIRSEYYFSPLAALKFLVENEEDMEPLSLLTICVLVLQNGFTVMGSSACASPENFDEEVGRRVARQDAVGKVWPLMGYALKTELWGDELLSGELPDDE